MARVTVTDPQEAARIIAAIADELSGSGELILEAYAQEVLRHALAAAGGRPTPQAPMAARTLRLDPGASHGVGIKATSGSSAAIAVGVGSERGSSWFPQFGARRPSGYWLRPAADARSAFDAAADALDKLIAAELGA